MAMLAFAIIYGLKRVFPRIPNVLEKPADLKIITAKIKSAQKDRP
jgi:hypothetical protein